MIAALEPGRTCRAAALDAVRLGPDDNQTAVTAVQVREVVTRLTKAGHWRKDDPAILIVPGTSDTTCTAPVLLTIGRRQIVPIWTPVATTEPQFAAAPNGGSRVRLHCAGFHSW